MTECPIYGLVEDADNLSAFPVSATQEIRVVKPYDLSYIDGTDTVIEPSSTQHPYARISKDSDFDSEAIYAGPNQRKPYVNPTINLKKKASDVDTSHIPFDNVIDVDQSDIQYVQDLAETHTQKLMEVMLKQHAPLALASELAQTQVEAIFKDCFEIEIDPDIDFENQLDFISRLDTFCYLLSVQKNIPKTLRTMVTEKAVEKLIVDWTTNTTKSYRSEGTRKAKAAYDNASTRVKESSEDRSEIAVRGSRRG